MRYKKRVDLLSTQYYYSFHAQLRVSKSKEGALVHYAFFIFSTATPSTKMDFDKLTATNEWLKQYQSSIDGLSIILKVSIKYALNNKKKHPKLQLIELYKVCHEIASLLRDKIIAKEICNSIGCLYCDISRFNYAVDYYMKALSICQETGALVEEGWFYWKIGHMYQLLRQYEKAMEYHKKGLRISQDTGHLAGEELSYCSIGDVYHSLGQYEKAMEYRKKGLRICQETGHSVDKLTAISEWFKQYESSFDLSIILRVSIEYALSNEKKHTKRQLIELYKVCHEIASLLRHTIIAKEICNSIGCLYCGISRFNDAVDYYMKALSICQETGDLVEEGWFYWKIGHMYQLLRQYEKAMEYHKKGLRIRQKTGDLEGEGLSYSSIGDVYHSLGQYEKAMKYHKKYLRICQEMSDLEGGIVLLQHW